MTEQRPTLDPEEWAIRSEILCGGLSLTPAEFAAWDGLTRGDLEPLADWLAGNPSTFPPIIVRQLLKLLRGRPEETDFRLAVERHPEIRHAAKTQASARERNRVVLETAAFMYERGALVRGQFDAAVADTTKKFGIERATAIARWSRKKEIFVFIEACKEKIFDRASAKGAVTGT